MQQSHNKRLPGSDFKGSSFLGPYALSFYATLELCLTLTELSDVILLYCYSPVCLLFRGTGIYRTMNCRGRPTATFNNNM